MRRPGINGSGPHPPRNWSEDFWALEDVAFEVHPGEAIGIIGRNGAGKSTLLKILSRITKPTTGHGEIHGRVGSLLEVGTGFHPELTGRENIYLNGSILGMNRQEVAGKFDEIVAFSGIEKFLDTPVKRYSSGMYVRLAFAVAAHLDPEILLIDEVLAVGDAAYQRRCIDRMNALARSGRTILFVSHNMDIIPRLCSRVIHLEAGRIKQAGPAEEVIQEYLHSQLQAEMSGKLVRTGPFGKGPARFERLRLIDEAGHALQTHRFGDDLILEMEIAASRALADVELAVVLQTQAGSRFATSWTREFGRSIDLEPGRQTIRCTFRNARLRPGHRISVGLWMAAQEVLDFVENALTIDLAVTETALHLSSEKNQGIVVLDSEWGPCAPAE